jgi:hypothetical protein
VVVIYKSGVEQSGYRVSSTASPKSISHAKARSRKENVLLPARDRYVSLNICRRGVFSVFHPWRLCALA